MIFVSIVQGQNIVRNCKWYFSAIMSMVELNPKKCHIAQPRVKLLGHVISENGIEADPDKVKVVILLPSPSNTK